MRGSSLSANKGKSPVTGKIGWDQVVEQRLVGRSKKMKLETNWDLEEETGQIVRWDGTAPNDDVMNTSNTDQFAITGKPTEPRLSIIHRSSP